MPPLGTKGRAGLLQIPIRWRAGDEPILDLELRQAACPREKKAGACGNQGDMGGSRSVRMTTWECLEGDAPYPVS
jgi:hypothetical protein